MASAEDVEKVSLAMSKASIQVVEEEVEVKKKIGRHCAFCLTLVPGEEVKFCEGCKKRAYCSKECQVADWKLPKKKPAWNGKIHGYGQGHKNWCGVSYGEEDLDWEVAPISGKGLGIVALRDIPPLYRIIVEGMQLMPAFKNEGGSVYRSYHPGLDDLVPSSASLPEKFSLNAQDTSAGFSSKVGLRISKANHNCDANSSSNDDTDFNVMILLSSREIKKGEEITCAYIRFDDLCNVAQEEYRGKSQEFLRSILFTKWGITCPPSCVCRDEEKIKMVEMCQKLHKECERGSPMNALPKMEKIIEVAGKIGCCASSMNVLYYYASGYAQQSFDMAKKRYYLGKLIQFNRAMFHPNNEAQVKGWEDNMTGCLVV